MPQITPLELGIATAAVFVLFGPKKLPSIGSKKNESVDLSALVAQHHARQGSTSSRPPIRGQFDVAEPQYGSGPNQAAAIRRAMPPASSAPPVPQVQVAPPPAAPQYAPTPVGAPRAVAPIAATAPLTESELAPLKLPENA